MKKILYSILAISTICFATSCNTNEKGTSTEVESANDDEHVDPDHLRGYGNQPPNVTGNLEGSANATYQERAENIAGRMASDLGLSKPTQVKVEEIYTTQQQQLGQLENAANAIGQRGGEPDNDALNDEGTNNNTSPDPQRPNTQGNAYADNQNPAGTSNQDNPDRSGGTVTNANSPGAGSPEEASPQDVEAARKKIMQQTEDKLKAILTPEQWQKYQQNREEYKL